MSEARVDKLSTPVLSDENALKLGIFATNLRGGATLADVPGNLQGTWEETLGLARRADRMGLDAVIPIARWRGYGGAANLGDRSFETFTWAAGLLARTRRIQVFSTFHVPVLAVSSWPTVVVPEIVGATVFDGATGAAATTEVCADVACALPAVFVPVSTTRTVPAMSALARV